MSGSVLIVDDVPTNRSLLEAKLAAAYYPARCAASGEEALAMAREEIPDMVLLDVMMPGLDGYEVCRRLKADPALSHVPVVMITALNSPEERLRGLEAGADDFLSKPINDLALLARVRNLARVTAMIDELRLRETTMRALGLDGGANLLDAPARFDARASLLADDPVAAGAACATLRGALGVSAAAAASRSELVRAAAEPQPPELFLIDLADAPDADLLRLVDAVNMRAGRGRFSVIVVVGPDQVALAARALDAGASDYLMRPVDQNELAARARAHLRRKWYSDRLRACVDDGLMLAAVDPLTGLYNRRYAAAHLDAMLAGPGPVAMMMLDLDRFKAVNDAHGHAAGDAALVEFARRLRACVRGGDLVARHGGEEFFVAMPDTGRQVAEQIAERVRDSVQNAAFGLPDGGSLGLTVSVGVAISSPGQSANTLLCAADAALYRSKSGGRNRVTFAAAA